MTILSRVFVLVVLASGCSPQMNYRAPRGWLDRRLPAGRLADWVPPPAAAPVTDPQVEAISRQRAAA